MDEDTTRASQETPAAYLYLVDTRSDNQSQQLFPIWEREIFRVGRDPHSNTLAVDNDTDTAVSRNHCEIYTVVYEPTVNHIYVRDRKSSNGTFVNGQLIGSGPEISPGYLLQDVVQNQPPPRHKLTSLQQEECKLFASKYSVTDRCLGQGAEAAVCLANDVQTGKQLVCKLINLDKIQGKNAQEDIRRKFQEADILRQLRHPNILPYVDAISSPHSLYTFTELASGGDLMSFLHRHGTVRELDSRIIIRQVVRGLCYLHEKEIVHRDLKPENILLAYSPKIAYHRVMLSDFGNSAVPRRSRMLTNAGTTGYQAPEFLTSGQAHTSAVDIWSLGVVALVLLASDHHDTELNRMDEEEVGEYIMQLFNALPKRISSDGIDFVWSCLKPDPLHRISAHEARSHDWLCNPQKNRELYRRMDFRILSSWKPQNKLKPMPWVLPDLALSNSPTPSRSPGSSTSQYFTTTPTRVKSPPKESENNADTQAKPDSERELEGAVPTFVVPARPSNANSRNLEAHPAQTKVKQIQPPWKDFLKPGRSSTVDLPSKRRRVPRSRVHDTAGLPLPGLDRHLRAPAKYHHRQDVLSALERTKSKFLVDKSPNLPSAPLDTLDTALLAPPTSPKKRKSTYDMRVQGSAGIDILHPPPQMRLR
ncbi:related to calmodulin-binding protein kinase [Fusarium torulosum]|uniref:Related to calmodulin-binding protein kinase n=1 Tax=Fusarium torulosum TaxID=33205 RepID=A0AAE8SHL3_9HYPO|nr:related to calmodulin-binding protein kinase [Fusarium torulosum]